MITLEILKQYAAEHDIYSYQKKDKVGRFYKDLKEITLELVAAEKKFYHQYPKDWDKRLFFLALGFQQLHRFHIPKATVNVVAFETPFYSCLLEDYEPSYMKFISKWTMKKLTAYYNRRMSEIYPNKAANITTVKDLVETKIADGIGYGIHKEVKEEKKEAFSLDLKKGGVSILVTQLNGEPISYEDGKGNWLEYRITRKHPYLETPDSKYLLPKGLGTYPFFSERTKAAFKAKEKINTLVITEGAVKAERAAQEGIHIVGLSSITHYADHRSSSTKKKIHEDIAKLIKICQIKKVIILHDGDCREIALQDLELEQDLTTRPRGFYAAAKKTSELLQQIELEYKLKIRYSTINSRKIKGNPKGIDDLLNSVEANERSQVIKQLLGSKEETMYFKSFSIAASTKRLLDWFCIKDDVGFYDLHQNKILQKEYIFQGDRYQWNEDLDDLSLLVPKYLERLYWIGNDFFELAEVPVTLKNKEIMTRSHLNHISKTTCADLYGPRFVRYLKDQWYSGFCNVPSHFDYQKDIKTKTGRFYNRYFPFQYEPAAGDCDITLDFVRHIFGEQYELGLDYIQLLLTQPTQKLPVLILYSPENGTGKSLFCEYLFELFKNNAVFINNDVLKSEFGADIYLDKLLAMCEETMLERKNEAEKIKGISTASAAITANPKGLSHYQINTSVKFIFCTNRKRMIYVTKEDERYWIIRLNKPKQQDTHLKEKMLEEIPQFVNYLLQRKLHTEDQDHERMWFRFEDIKTDVLKTVVGVNEHSDVRELKEKLEAYFLQFPQEEKLELATKDIIAEFLKGKNSAWVTELLAHRMGIKKTKKNGKNLVKRSYFLKMVWYDSINDYKTQKIKTTSGQVWCFERKDFVTEEVEYEEIEEPLTQKQIDDINKEVLTENKKTND